MSSMSYFKNQTACRPRPLIIITNTSTTIFSHTHRLYNITSSLTMWTRSSISSDMRPQQVPIFNSSELKTAIDRSTLHVYCSTMLYALMVHHQQSFQIWIQNLFQQYTNQYWSSSTSTARWAPATITTAMVLAK